MARSAGLRGEAGHPVNDEMAGWDGDRRPIVKRVDSRTRNGTPLPARRSRLALAGLRRRFCLDPALAPQRRMTANRTATGDDETSSAVPDPPTQRSRRSAWRCQQRKPVLAVHVTGHPPGAGRGPEVHGRTPGEPARARVRRRAAPSPTRRRARRATAQFAGRRGPVLDLRRSCVSGKLCPRDGACKPRSSAIANARCSIGSCACRPRATDHGCRIDPAWRRELDTRLAHRERMSL